MLKFEGSKPFGAMVSTLGFKVREDDFIPVRVQFHSSCACLGMIEYILRESQAIIPNFCERFLLLTAFGDSYFPGPFSKTTEMN